mgnify:CR=1 FL=1
MNLKESMKRFKTKNLDEQIFQSVADQHLYRYKNDPEYKAMIDKREAQSEREIELFKNKINKSIKYISIELKKFMRSSNDIAQDRYKNDPEFKAMIDKLAQGIIDLKNK